MSETPIASNVSREIRMRIRQISIFTGGTIVAQGLMILNALLLARHLSPNGYGVLVGTYAVAILTSVIFNWGLDTWILRQGETDLDPKIIAGAVMLIKAGLGLIWMIVLISILPRFSPTIFFRSFVLVVAFDVLLDGILRVEIATFNVTEKYSWASLALIISRGGRIVGTLLLIEFKNQSPVDFAGSRLIANGVAVLIAAILLKPQFMQLRHLDLAKILRQSFPFALSDFLSAVYAQIDLVLLALIRGDSEDLGTYSPASSLINATFLLPGSVYTFLIPLLSREYAKRPGTFTQSFKRLFILFLALGGLLWLGTTFIGIRLIDWLLGSAYAKTGLMIAALAPITFMKSLSYASASLLVVVGWQKKRVIAQSISAIANVVANIFLIIRFGVWGAIMAYMVSELILLMGYSVLALRWLSNRPLARKEKIENNG